MASSVEDSRSCFVVRIGNETLSSQSCQNIVVEAITAEPSNFQLPGAKSCFVRRYAEGKYAILSEGRPAYCKLAEVAFANATNVVVRFDQERFRKELEDQGVPKAAIDEFNANLHINDDTYSFEKSY